MTDLKESLTAKLCSFARAYHSNNEKDKIFDDYLAYDIMGKEEYEEMGSLIYHNFDMIKSKEEPFFKSEMIRDVVAEFLAPIPLSRISYAEKKLNEFTKIHKKSQYVICGAGADTFSFRNSNENIQVFEIDHPATQKYKLNRIHKLEWNIPRNVHYVPVNFEKDDMMKALDKAGFDKNKPTFFSILGVTYYLTLPVFEETVKKIAQMSTNENMILFDYPDKTLHGTDGKDERLSKIAKITASLGETMQQGFTFEILNAMLKSHGFYSTEHMTPEIIQNHFFEGRKDAHKAFDHVHFLSAVFRG